jgi:hypothetical protein
MMTTPVYQPQTQIAATPVYQQQALSYAPTTTVTPHTPAPVLTAAPVVGTMSPGRVVASRVVNPILSTEPATHVGTAGGVNEREYQRSHQWDSRHNAYGPSGVGSNLYFPNGDIPPPPMLVTPEGPQIEEPEPIPQGPEFYDLGRGYERDKRGMYGIDLSQPPGPPQRVAPKAKIRSGERAIVSANNQGYNNYRPREFEDRIPDG